MKRQFAALGAVAVLLGAADVGEAASRRRNERTESRLADRRIAVRGTAVRERDFSSSYYERDSRVLPFGSSRWWEQIDRERGGSSRD